MEETEAPEDTLKSENSVPPFVKSTAVQNITVTTDQLIDKLRNDRNKNETSSSVNSNSGKRKSLDVSPEPLSSKKYVKQTSSLGYVVPLKKDEGIKNYEADDVEESDFKYKSSNDAKNIVSCLEQESKVYNIPDCLEIGQHEGRVSQGIARYQQTANDKESVFCEVFQNIKIMCEENGSFEERDSTDPLHKPENTSETFCPETVTCDIQGISPSCDKTNPDIFEQCANSKLNFIKPHQENLSEHTDEQKNMSDAEEPSPFTDFNWGDIKGDYLSSKACELIFSCISSSQENAEKIRVDVNNTCEDIKFNDESVDCDTSPGETTLILKNPDDACIRKCTLKDSWTQVDVSDTCKDIKFKDESAGCDTSPSETTWNLENPNGSCIRRGTVKDSWTQVDINNAFEDIKFKVVSVDRDSCPGETTLLLENPNDGGIRTCTLKNSWNDQFFIRKGDEVRVLAPFLNDHAIIDTDSGYMIVNPDYLVSSTSVSSTVFCLRKSVLSQKLRRWGNVENMAMLIGNIVHQLFQEAAKHCVYEENKIKDISSKIMKQSENLFSMYCQDLTEDEVNEQLLNYFTSISNSIKKYCVPSSENASLGHFEVCDIEDNIWSPVLGMKGKLDLTVKVKSYDRKRKQKKTTMVVPLELKSGRFKLSVEHESQVTIYTMLMQDRRGWVYKDVGDGLLLYLKDGPQMKHIEPNHNLRRGLIQMRNELVYYLSDETICSAEGQTVLDRSMWTLPPPINNKQACEMCSLLLPCCLLQKSEDFSPPDSHCMATLVPQVTSHLSESHMEYFLHWCNLLDLENKNKISSAFWNVDAYTREKQGFGISHLELSDDILTHQDREGGDYVHSFIRAPDCPIDSSFSSVGLKPGDNIVISNQKNRLEVALAVGFVAKISADFVQVLIERNLQTMSRYKGYLFRLDKVNSNGVHLGLYCNLLQLMTPDPFSSYLRSLIIDVRKPEFLLTLRNDVFFYGFDVLSSLNASQVTAILQALMVNDFMLLEGMPGTGKTSTIVALVRLFVRYNCSVLLVSHTHSAVDNILLKLMKYGIDFLRLGPSSKLHPDILPFSFDIRTKDVTSVKEMQKLFQSKVVVASSCLGLRKKNIFKKRFDVCIVDEASQVLQAECLGPLYYAKKFILVGDSKQLPPVVQSDNARHAGMQETLFSRLENREVWVKLNIQYRMNKEIMRLCNDLTYEGALECGSKDISSATLNLKSTSHICNKEWLLVALDSALSKSVMFLNTDEIPARESLDVHGLSKNDIEADLVTQIVKCMVVGGVPVQDIGVITPYRCQVELIRKCLRNMKLTEVEVNTVDQYQGKDKCAILISCVKSAELPCQRNLDDTILGDARRLNVAISRAKQKLLIIGSKSTLIWCSAFKKLIDSLRTDQILNLPGTI